MKRVSAGKRAQHLSQILISATLYIQFTSMKYEEKIDVFASAKSVNFTCVTMYNYQCYNLRLRNPKEKQNLGRHFLFLVREIPIEITC